MRGNIIRAVVKMMNNDVDPKPYIVSFFREFADYSMDEKDLERAINNALEIPRFVKENRIKPGPVERYERCGRVKYVMFDGVLPDGRRLIVENSDDYEAKRALARRGDIVIRVEPDFSIKVVEVIE